MSYEIPRRIRIDLYTPAEQAIHEAVAAVEAAGADVRLTRAVILLSEAQEQVADYVDDVWCRADALDSVALYADAHATQNTPASFEGLKMALQRLHKAKRV